LSTRFGDIEVDQILRNEYRIGVLEKVVEELLKNTHPNAEALERIRTEVVEGLKKKYPNSGIELQRGV